MTNSNPTDTDLTNNGSVISAPTHSGSTDHIPAGRHSIGVNPANSDNMTADPMAQPQPPAQDAGQTTVAPPDLHTSPPTEPLPLTSSTGTGFNTPDAGTGLPDNNIDTGVGNPGPMPTPVPADNAPLPGVGNIDRDTLAGQNKGAGSQANAEAVSSTGPV